MPKRSLKYFLIAAVNMGLLTLLLALWTDDMEIRLDNLVRPIEFIKIVLITGLCLILMRVLSFRINKRGDKELIQKKAKYAICLTLLVSSYMYVTYSVKAFNRLFSGPRKALVQKLDPTPVHGIRADELTYEEYSALDHLPKFHPIPEVAQNISVLYYYDGFLPDYTFNVSYDVPLSTEIKEEHYKNHDFSRDINVEIKGDKKHVSYEEGEM